MRNTELMRLMMKAAIQAALKQLLSEKHLYQFVKANTSFVPKMAEEIREESRPIILQGGRSSSRMSLEDAKAYCTRQTKVIWYPKGVSTTGTPGFPSGWE